MVHIGQGRDGFTRQIYRGCGKTNRDKADRSQDRFRVEMESCGDPVSARAFPQALTHPRKLSFRSLSICLADYQALNRALRRAEG